MWNFIPYYVFSKIGGLRFLSVCSSNIGKIPIHPAWSMLYKQHFSTDCYFIWKNILNRNKSVLFKGWFNDNTAYVSQLVEMVF